MSTEESEEEEEERNSEEEDKVEEVSGDPFFNRDEMESFLSAEDVRAERKADGKRGDDDDGVDLFADMDTDEEEDDTDNQGMKYADFWLDKDTILKSSASKATPSSIKEESDPESEQEEEEKDDNFVPSSFDLAQKKIKSRISQLEGENLAEKNWQMKGETDAKNRPRNALLQEHLDFEHTTRPDPVITEETSALLEKLIIQRIKDKSWDDTERKIKPKEDPYEYKKRLVLNQEKSKLSLTEIYQQEYQEQEKTEKEEKEDESHVEIRKQMTALFVKLDALTNFHFTPKPMCSDVVIVSNNAALTVEEVAPSTLTEAQRLAPEEILDKKAAEISKDEMTKTDKNRMRRKKKLRQKFKYANVDSSVKILHKLQSGTQKLHAKQNKQSTAREGKIEKKSNRSSSKAFFSKLDETQRTPQPHKRSKLKHDTHTLKL